ncbi:SRPBCC domain-containing protein [Streptomyces sp. NPDC059783]|uniref:SRPBCC domain-containing protein n=1 Tax=Streptomyces sp. NPDC059783 TaxID=3346944 RepID=UPI0036477800
MEHEVFVPVPVPALRRALDDPARVARCVPGLQRDADASAGPLSGRLRIRAGGHTITYRGALRLTPSPDAADGAAYALSVEGEGAEARGGGSALLSLTLRLTARDDGTAITFAGTATGEGRILELDPAAALSAAHRLLDRFARQLVTESLAAHGEDGAEGGDGASGGSASGDSVADDSASGDPASDDSASGTAVPAAGKPPVRDEKTSGASGEKPAPDEKAVPDEKPVRDEKTSGASGEKPVPDEKAVPDEKPVRDEKAVPDEKPVRDEGPPAVSADEEQAVGEAVEQAIEEAAEEADEERGSVFDAPVPPSSLDPVAGIEFTVPDGPPAEAAHARRTMIGRSAEEVDHAPPRGRYAPVPSPDATGAGATLRWVAPAAALALASAVVVGRALRRRK